MQRSKELVQLEPPALLGRRARVKAFKEFVESNRLKLKSNQLVARYCVDTGISQSTILSYLKLFYQARIYVKPHWRITNDLILTPQEYERARVAYMQQQEAKEQEERERLNDHE